jgi:UDP-N-acetylglucosamine--N-acetylmuramyl-(pentapeptide) pyrophosphoryl-undecaprenol N-acetylglucosamine transferase
MKLLIVAAPALAVIEKLPKDVQLLVVGRKYVFEGDRTLSLEYQTAKKLGIPFKPLTTGRLQRKFTRYTINSLLKIPIGLTQATSIISQFRPDVVLSFGGYVSVPITLAASILRIPFVVHEQTLDAGISNKLVAKFAAKVCISWEESRKFFPEGKIILTGNPLRKEFEMGDLRTDKFKNTISFGRKSEPTIYITGGSSGSHAINVLIEGCVGKLLRKFNIIHQTGASGQYKDFERLSELRDNLQDELKSGYKLVKFIEPSKVADFLNTADLVISRSGMNTITELIYFGKPSMLIPLPYGQHQEQLKNAVFMKKLGLAEIVEQNETSPVKLYSKISEMFDNINLYKKNADLGKKLIDINAADKIIEVIKDAGIKKKN